MATAASPNFATHPRCVYYGHWQNENGSEIFQLSRLKRDSPSVTLVSLERGREAKARRKAAGIRKRRPVVLILYMTTVKTL